MESNQIVSNYIVADGPEGLARVLADIYEQTQADNEAKLAEQYILYQLNNQKSFIKVDLSQKPFQFWYCDMLGRPITRVVKDTIAKFIWEHGGEKEEALNNLNREE